MVTWTIFFSILLIIILFQTTLGNYGNNVIYAFWWLLSTTLPYMFLVVFRYWRKRSSSEQMPYQVDNTIGLIVKILSILYLLTVLTVLLIQPVFSPGSTIQFFKNSMPGLYIFQGILIAACILLDYRIRKNAPGIDSKPQNAKSKPVVFISYNHNDKAAAQQIRTLLEKKKIEVILDSDDMDAGEVINQFIIDSVNKATITLSILSTNSLMSGYVSMETIRTFYAEEFTNKKKFIACYLDDEFMHADFIIRSVKKIDEKLDEIKSIIDQQDALDVDTQNLNSQKTRLYDLRQNLDKIVEKLNASLCIDIRGEKLTANFPKILESITD